VSTIPCRKCGSLTANDDRLCDRCQRTSTAPDPARAATPPVAAASDLAARIRKVLPLIIASDLAIVAFLVYWFILRH
jgi:uncharacterized membrane protein YvbJ